MITTPMRLRKGGGTSKIQPSPSFATGAVGGPRRPINTRSGLEGLHYGRLCRQRFDLAAGGDSGRGLRGQFQAELGEQEFLSFVGRSVAPEDQGASIGSREVDVEHLHGTEELED